MTNVLNIFIICWIRICFGQDRSFNSQDYYQSKTPLQYKNNCNDTWRMITDDDVMKHERELLHYFKDTVWINLTIRYTPWVTDKGLFNYSFSSTDIIEEFNISTNETQFIECYLLCSKHKWSYIGLKQKRCYCLSSSALVQATSYSDQPRKSCVTGYIPQCHETHIAVYEQDTNTYQGIENCLSAKFVNSSWLTSTTPCNSNSSILCVGKTGTEPFKYGALTQRHRAVGYCEEFETISFDFKTLISTLTMIKQTAYGINYWMNNFRESYVSTPVLTRHLGSTCATGKSNNGKIVMTSTNCDNKSAYTLCIKDAQHNTSQITIGTTVSQEDKIMPSNITDSNQTTTAEMIPNIRFEFSTIVIIIAAAGSLLILLVLIGVVLLIRYRKQRKPSTPLGPVYATVLKEMIQKANVINHGLSPEGTHDTIEEDNTYDHTTFMTRPPFQLGDVSNYDTMENMQVTGEYNYQHMVTFKKSTCVAEIVDSVYNHTSDFPPPPNIDDDSM